MVPYRHFARLALRRPLIILAVWTSLFAVSVPFADKLPGVLQDHGLVLENGMDSETRRLLEAEFGIPTDPVILLFEKQSEVPRRDFHAYISHTLDRLRDVKGLQYAVPPFGQDRMENGDYAYALLVFRQPAHEMAPAIAELRRRIARDESGAIAVKLTGKAVVQHDVNRLVRHDLGRAEAFGVPAAFLILLLAFGGAVSAMIPVITGLVCVSSAMAAMALIGRAVGLSVFVLNVIPMAGLALSIDFALLLVSRFREELGRRPVPEALAVTMATAGRTVVFSALCVLLGLGGMLFIRLPMFYTVALGAMIVLLLALAAALTLIPALLALCAERIRRESGSRRASGRSAFWRSLADAVMKRPVRMALLASAALAACFWPLANLEVAIPDASSLPRGTESRLAAEQFARHFEPPSVSQVYVIAETERPAPNLSDWNAALSLVRRLERDPAVLRVDSVFSGRMPDKNTPFSTYHGENAGNARKMRTEAPAENDAGLDHGSDRRLPANHNDTNGMRDRRMRTQDNGTHQMHESRIREHDDVTRWVRGNRMLISVTLRHAPGTKEAAQWMRERETGYGGLRLVYGGEAKYRQEVFDEIFGRIPYTLLFLFASNSIILLAAFRSVLIPLKTVLMNLLGICASFGILAAVFQESRFGLEPTAIAVMIPVFVFGLVFGISMDYGVFLLSRMQETYRVTGNNDAAVREGLANTSATITAAAAIMIAVTLPFAWGGVSGVKQLGIGIATSIFIDATLVRMILVPSLMKLFGRWNWWLPLGKTG